MEPVPASESSRALLAELGTSEMDRDVDTLPLTIFPPKW